MDDALSVVVHAKVSETKVFDVLFERHDLKA